MCARCMASVCARCESKLSKTKNAIHSADGHRTSVKLVHFVANCKMYVISFN